MAPQVTAQALRSPAMDLLPHLLQFSDPEVRAAAAFALGAMIQAHSPAFPGPGLGGGSGTQRMGSAERLQAERQIAEHLLPAVEDASPLVRSEVAVAFGRVACGHADMFQVRMLLHCHSSMNDEVCKLVMLTSFVPHADAHVYISSAWPASCLSSYCRLRYGVSLCQHLGLLCACTGCCAFQPASYEGCGPQQHA